MPRRLHTVIEVEDGLPERIAKACQESREADEAARLLKRQRNQLLVEAVDAGHSQRAVSRMAGMAIGTLCRILGTPQED